MHIATVEEIDAEFARRDLHEFIKQAWHVVEPSTPYIDGWHIKAICEHLEAVNNLEIRNLLINMPPRHAKSLIVSVFWPCWTWLKSPGKRWLFSSYAQVLSTRDSLKCRRLIQSPWYQRNFGHVYKLTGDQNQKTRFENTKQGYRIATSVGGSGTGEGGDYIICDDPHNITESESEAVRESTLIWWDETMSTRGNDPKTFSKVIIMQRAHARDLSGHVLEQGGYDHLCLPAEYEGKKIITSIGWQDPREKEGELLWPERFGPKELAELKRVLGVYGSAGQLQQRPAPREGGLIKLEYFKYYTQLPRLAYIIQSWDTAFKVKTINDYSVCTTWGLGVDGNFYLVDRFRGKLEFPELKKKMFKLWQMYNPFAILIEDKASGQSLIQEMSRPMTDPDHKPSKEDKQPPQIYKLPVKPIQVDVDKVERVSACTTTMETNTYLPKNAPWLDEYLDELTTFPNGAHDDQVDSTSQALIHLVLRRGRGVQAINLDVMGR